MHTSALPNSTEEALTGALRVFIVPIMNDALSTNRPLYTTETRTYPATRRAIGKCKVCKATHRTVTQLIVTKTETWGICGGKTRYSEKVVGGREYAVCCGRIVSTKRIEGHRNDTPCDERCTEAKGHRCECSCGGANHGAGHDVTR